MTWGKLLKELDEEVGGDNVGSVLGLSGRIVESRRVVRAFERLGRTLLNRLLKREGLVKPLVRRERF